MGDNIPIGEVSDGAVGVNYGTIILGEGPRTLHLSSGHTDLPADPLPSQYLIARHAVVKYAGREALLTNLDEWATSGHPVRVRLLTGPAGTGKTRLAQEWIRRCRLREERAGFLDDLLSPPVIDAIVTQEAAIVIDYAETRNTLGELLRRLARRRDEGGSERLRVLLLARGIGDWWSLATRDDAALALVQDPGPWEIPPIEALNRAAEFARAAEHFAPLRKWAAVPSPPDLSDPHYGRPLYLHLAAWLAGERDGLLDKAGALPGRLLNHEAKYWLRRGGFEGREGTDEALQLERSTQAVLAAVTLQGGARDKDHLAALLSLADKEVRSKVGALLTGLYRTPTHLVGSLEPDLLGEILVLRLLHDTQWHPGWLDRVVEGASTEELTHAFTVLGRVESIDPEAAEAAEGRLLMADPMGRAEPALQALLALAAHTAHARLGSLLAASLKSHGTSTIARALQPYLPHHTVQLRDVAAWILLAVSEEDDQSIEQVRQLNNLAWRLAELGRLEEALSTTEKAIRISSAPLTEHPDEVLIELAYSLNGKGVWLSDLGRTREALDAAREATHHYRDLAARYPKLVDRQFAASLNNLSNRLLEVGRRGEALEVALEALDLRKGLAENSPAEHLPDLALSFNNVGVVLTTLGRNEEAMAATREAVAVRRRLADQLPDAFLPDLAMSLNNLATELSRYGLTDEAVSAAEESTRIYRRLHLQHPDSFGRALARSLHNLGSDLGILGRSEEARFALEEAVGLYRVTAPAGALLNELSSSLGALATQLGNDGQVGEALLLAEEAVGILRTLAEEEPEAFLPGLARAVSIHGDLLSRFGYEADGALAADEALNLLWPSFLNHPATHAELIEILLNDCLGHYGALPELLARWTQFRVLVG